MTINRTLLHNIERLLGTTTVSNLDSDTAACDLFEVYIFTLVLEAAREEGADITYEDVLGVSPPARFVFRTSPGHIFSQERPYTHAIIQFRNAPTLEAHVGIRISGKSGVLHECDVAVLLRDEAVSCRWGNAAPRHSKVLLSVECKFYSANIPLYQARAFMGLLVDIKSDNRFFVVNTHSSSVEKLLAHHKKNWEHNLTPDSTRYVNKLRTAFEKKFANFKAKHS